MRYRTLILLLIAFSVLAVPAASASVPAAVETEVEPVAVEGDAATMSSGCSTGWLVGSWGKSGARSWCSSFPLKYHRAVVTCKYGWSTTSAYGPWRPANGSSTSSAYCSTLWTAVGKSVQVQYSSCLNPVGTGRASTIQC